MQENVKSFSGVLWITGLSGSGKTTLAKRIKASIKNAILLDGDVLRSVLGYENKAFDVDGRKQLAFTYAKICKMLADQGFTVIIATISLFHELHAWNRENLPNYVEIFLDINETTRRKRDPKGLYKEQAKGNMEMAGIETLVEFPVNPSIRIDETKSLDEAVKLVLNFLNQN